MARAVYRCLHPRQDGPQCPRSRVKFASEGPLWRETHRLLAKTRRHVLSLELASGLRFATP